uniref:Uncharacterized protein n=1 Tax=Anopheles farauti TaxID=69004 RepID=A0A182QLL4_9DIPT
MRGFVPFGKCPTKPNKRQNEIFDHDHLPVRAGLRAGVGRAGGARRGHLRCRWSCGRNPERPEPAGLPAEEAAAQEEIASARLRNATKPKRSGTGSQTLVPVALPSSDKETNAHRRRRPENLPFPSPFITLTYPPTFLPYRSIPHPALRPRSVRSLRPAFVHWLAGRSVTSQRKCM